MYPTKLSWVHCILIVDWVALQNCIGLHIDGFEQQWQQVFPLAGIFGRSVLQLYSWTTPSLAGFAEQPAAWRYNRFGEGWMEHSAHSRVCHQRVQSLEQSLFCSQALHKHNSTTNNHNRKFKLYFKGDGNCLTADVCGMCTALWVLHSELCVCQYRYCMHSCMGRVPWLGPCRPIYVWKHTYEKEHVTFSF